MSRFLTLVILSLHGSLIIASASEPVPAAKSVKSSTTWFAKASIGILKIEIKTPVVYLPEGQTALFSGFVQTALSVNHADSIYPTSGLFNVGGKPVSVDIEVGGCEITKDPRVDDFYRFTKTGDCQVLVSLGDECFSVPLSVRTFDFNVGDKSRDLIQTHGFPTSKERVFVSWPDSKAPDGIFYNPWAGQSSISASHWRFGKFPNLVVAIGSDDLIREINSDPPSDGHFDFYWHEKSFESLTNVAAKNEEVDPEQNPEIDNVAAKNEEVDPGRTPKIDTEFERYKIVASIPYHLKYSISEDWTIERLRLYKAIISRGLHPSNLSKVREFTDKTGNHSTKAIVVGFGDATVKLLKLDATEIEVALSTFSLSDRRDLIDIRRNDGITMQSEEPPF